MTLFEALTGGAFDRLNWQYSGEFDQVKCPRVCPGGDMGGFGIDRYITSSWVVVRFCPLRNFREKGVLRLRAVETFLAGEKFQDTNTTY